MENISQRQRMKSRADHYERFFGLPAQPPRILSGPSGCIEVLLYRPKMFCPYWTLVTNGMSDIGHDFPTNSRPHTELLMYPKDPKPWMYFFLGQLARLPFEHNVWLHYWAILSNRQYLKDYTGVDGFMFLPPYHEDEELGDFHMEAHRIDLLWAVPVTSIEMEVLSKVVTPWMTWQHTTL